MDAEGIQWFGIAAFAVGLPVFLFGLYFTPRKGDGKTAVNKRLWQWEGPSFMIVGIGLYLYPVEWALYASIPVLMIGSAIGVWFAHKDEQERKTRGEDV